MSSMSLAIKLEDDIIFGLLVSQSKASLVTISPIRTKDVVARAMYPVLTSATSMYSSIDGIWQQSKLELDSSSEHHSSKLYI